MCTASIRWRTWPPVLTNSGFISCPTTHRPSLGAVLCRLWTNKKHCSKWPGALGTGDFYKSTPKIGIKLAPDGAREWGPVGVLILDVFRIVFRP